VERLDTGRGLLYIVETIDAFKDCEEVHMRRSACTGLVLSLVLFVISTAAYAFKEDGSSAPTSSPERQSYSQLGPSSALPEKWQTFISKHDVSWSLTWDDYRDIPHRALFSGLVLPGSIDESNVAQACLSFVAENEALFGVRADELETARSLFRGKWYLLFQQTYGGVPVYGGRVHFRVARSGEVLMFGSECYPGISLNVTPSVPEEAAIRTAETSVDFSASEDELLEVKLVVYPGGPEENNGNHLTWLVRMRTKSSPGNWFVFVDAHSNEIVYSENQIRFDDIYGTVTGFMLPEYYDETPVEMPYAHETVTVPGYGSNNSDPAGYYLVTVGPAGDYPVQSMLSGPYVEVINNDGAEALHSDTASTSFPHDWAWTAPGDGLPDEINVYYHVVHVHDWIKGPPFNFSGMDYQMIAEVRYGVNYDNAFYDGRDIHFGEGSNMPGGFRNLALFSDVIYHEYTHGIIDHIYTFGSGDEFGAMHEGFADYMACTQNEDPDVGDGGLVYNGGALRSLKNNRRYPEDFIGEVHNDGLIIGGSMWDLRTYEGATLTDSLWVFALYGEALTFADYLTEVLIADDDNGNLGDGTPHACSIYLAFGNHGIGPGVATIDHTPLRDTEDTLNPYPVVAIITPNLPLNDTIWLSYAVEPDTIFTQVPMDSTGNPDEYEGLIPAQSEGSTIHYYLSVLCMTLPAHAPLESLYTFHVGADTISPSIDHLPLADMPIAGWPATVFSEVTDNIALESVTLEYRRNGMDETPLAMPRIPGTDAYAVKFASAADTGDIFEYRIIAVDSSSASNTAYEPSDMSYHSFQVCFGFFDDMESGQGDWTHAAGGPFGYVDQWHLSQYRNYDPLELWSWKCGGTDSADYANRNHSLLVTPDIDIAAGSVMSFWHWMEAETLDDAEAWDGGLVEISTDGGSNWTQIVPDDGYKFTIVDNPGSPFAAGTPCFSGSFDWRRETFDISSYSGYVQFRFNFGSDGYVVREGWYVDEASVYFCPEPGAMETSRSRRIPLFYRMSEPSPNPFSRSSSLRLELPAKSHVELKVYNAAGQLVRTLVNGTEEPGYTLVNWDGRDDSQREVPNGMYFCRLVCSREGRVFFDKASKVVLLRK
jgi:hypothetical protein